MGFLRDVEGKNHCMISKGMKMTDDEWIIALACISVLLMYFVPVLIGDLISLSRKRRRRQ